MDIGAVQNGLGMIRRQRQRPVDLRQAFLGPALLRQRYAQQLLRIGVTRIGRQRGAVQRFGFRQPAAAMQRRRLVCLAHIPRIPWAWYSCRPQE